jgi:hypothetical protein
MTVYSCIEAKVLRTIYPKRQGEACSRARYSIVLYLVRMKTKAINPGMRCKPVDFVRHQGDNYVNTTKRMTGQCSRSGYRGYCKPSQTHYFASMIGHLEGAFHMLCTQKYLCLVTRIFSEPCFFGIQLTIRYAHASMAINQVQHAQGRGRKPWSCIVTVHVMN